MPWLGRECEMKATLEGVRQLKVDPGDVRMPGRLYDDLVEQAKNVIERNPDED
jgi:hypothetical protein